MGTRNGDTKTRKKIVSFPEFHYIKPKIELPYFLYYC